jgi:hypothetical protein
VPVLYPDGLTRADQLIFGSLALAINAVVYWLVFVRRRRSVI